METVKKVTINGETHPIGVNWGDVDEKPSFAAVAVSGSYDDLSGRPAPYNLPVATNSTLGGVKITEGNGLNNDEGAVSVNLATSTLPGTITSTSYKTLDALNNIKITAFNPETGVITIGGKKWILEPYVEVGKGTAYYGGSYDNPQSLGEAFGNVDLNTTSQFDAKIETGTNGVEVYVVWFAVPTTSTITRIEDKNLTVDCLDDFTMSTELIDGYKVYYYEFSAQARTEWRVTVN